MGREQRAATGVRDHEITWRRACKIARQQQFHLEFQLLQRPQGALLLLPCLRPVHWIFPQELLGLSQVLRMSAVENVSIGQ